MEQMNRATLYNSNDENIEDVRFALERELEEDSGSDRAFTMLQRNSPSEVRITEESRRLCAGILTGLR